MPNVPWFQHRSQRPKMARILKPKVVGSVAIEHFDVGRDQAALHNVLSARRPEESIQPGRYARLLINGELVMSDTDFEWRTAFDFMDAAHGDVFVAGLGLGFTLIPVVKKAGVTSVTVLEKSPDVIAAVEPELRAHLSKRCGKKLTVIEGDVFSWEGVTNARYHTMWFDIWKNLNAENLEEMHALRLKYRTRRRQLPGAVMLYWGKSYIEQRLRRQGINTRRFGSVLP